MRLGERLVASRIIDEEQLKQALEIQAKSGGQIGEILQAITNIRSIDYYKTLAEHYQIAFVNLLKEPIDTTLLSSDEKEKYFSTLSLPIGKKNNVIIIATADPSEKTFDRLKKQYGNDCEIVCTSKFDILWILKKEFNTDYLDNSIYSLSNKYASLSARYTPSLGLRFFYVLPLIAIISLLIINPPLALRILNIVILTGLSGTIVFKIFLSIIGLIIAGNRNKKQVMNDLTLDDLPIYSILVPLYKEKKVTLKNLFHHLQKLIYPPHKLDIKILLEEDDLETINYIKKLKLPNYIEFIYVPLDGPRTKPKACNYGFNFIYGEYVCLYDAEDQPDPDQLIKVLQLFEKENDKKLACVQCKLSFYNIYENWLTRMFTIEYSYWFDLLLPALAFTEIPIPLGGTSNHFRTEVLREAFAWDPFNVTEDADLGLRLSRLGYKTKVLDVTTYEEANCQLINWIKQRTRWIKGYMQTYLVHMRNPFLLCYKIGLKGFLGFQLFIGGTVLSNLTNLPMWLITGFLILLPQYQVSYFFPSPYDHIAWLNLLIGTAGIVLLNLLGVIAYRKNRLALFALTSPIYWMLMSIASYRALYQLIFKPSYWDKTTHGISNVLSREDNMNYKNIDILTLSKTVKFGTSGIRGYNNQLTDEVCYAYMIAFLQYLENIKKISTKQKIVLGGDYRDNTDHIIKVLARACADKNYHVINCGKIPTPALALFCQAKSYPGAMVTGSHIPEDMNGIKFYLADGEILKHDEQEILKQIVHVNDDLFNYAGYLDEEDLYSVPISSEGLNFYRNRYLNFFSENRLDGLRIGVYQHSSVASNILIELLQTLGAQVVAFGESKHFHSLDTEAINLSDVQMIKHHMKLNSLDGIVSTDGDGDRPLITDEKGELIHGDIIGLLCAVALNAKNIVTTFSANSSIEYLNSIDELVRTKIGSPYIIEKINQLKSENKENILGYEANGGVLIGSDFTVNHQTLSALPTRDAIIAILLILTYVNQHDLAVSSFVAKYSKSFTYSNSIKSMTTEQIDQFFKCIYKDNAVMLNLQILLHLDQMIVQINSFDGIRAILQDNSVIYLRRSGNAPELRCYVETVSSEKAKKLNHHCMDQIREWSKAYESQAEH